MESVFIKKLNCFFLCSIYFVIIQPAKEDRSAKLQNCKQQEYKKRVELYKKLKILTSNLNGMIKKEKKINCFLDSIYYKDGKKSILKDPMYFFSDEDGKRMKEVLDKKTQLNALYKKIIFYRSEILKLKKKLFIRKTNT